MARLNEGKTKFDSGLLYWELKLEEKMSRNTEIISDSSSWNWC